MGLAPIWLGVMIAVNLQTSFLTPPFGFALFYLRGVAPPSVTTMHIYRGIVPFVIIQIIGLMLLPPSRQRRHGCRASSSHDRRSEEHTSELQSLMRISYAVFCLKKKTQKIRTQN